MQVIGVQYIKGEIMDYQRIHINGRTFKNFEDASKWLIANGQHEILEKLRMAIIFMRTHDPFTPAPFIDMALSMDENVYETRKPKPRKNKLLGDIRKSKTVDEFLKRIRRDK